MNAAELLTKVNQFIDHLPYERKPSELYAP